MRNVAPSHALARRARHLLQLAIILAVLGVFLAVLGLVSFIIPLFAPGTTWYEVLRSILLIVGVVVALVGVVLAIRAVTRRTENDLAMITGDFLGQYLDERYTFIRNINRSGLGYIDAVLVGPPGVLVFRILDNEGAFANEAANWLEQKPSGEWLPARISPTQEAVDDIQHARDYLSKHNLGDAPVFGVIVFTKDAPLVSVAAKEPVVPLSLLPSLVTNLGDNYLAKERIAPQMVTSLVRLLLEE